MTLIDLANREYQTGTFTFEQVTALEGKVLLEFGSPLCGYCMAARPIVQEVLSEHSDLPHLMIYDAKGERMGRAFKVKLWPTLILLQAGKEVARLIRPLRVDDVRQFMGHAK